MGVDDEIELIRPLDIKVLKWPKWLLGALYLSLVIWSCLRIFLFEMYQEEFFIRLILVALFIPLSGFVFAGYKWAMSSAYTVLLCYFGAFYLLLELRVSIGLVGFVVFLGVMTLRAMTASDQMRRLSHKVEAQIFE